MEPSIFIKGIFIGLLVCAPVGPIGVLCARRALMDGRVAGIVSALGASTVDGIYGAIACLGTTHMSCFLQREGNLLRLTGGLILIFIGTLMVSMKSKEKKIYHRGKGLIGAYASTFFLMLANPLPILVFGAVFTALGVHRWEGDDLAIILFLVGVFLGSVSWAPILVTLVRISGSHVSSSHLKFLNRVSGAIIIGFGALFGYMALIG